MVIFTIRSVKRVPFLSPTHFLSARFFATYPRPRSVSVFLVIVAVKRSIVSPVYVEIKDVLWRIVAVDGVAEGFSLGGKLS